MGDLLKGHATVELTNIKTGEKKVYEDDNFITGAAERLIQPLGCMGRGGQLYGATNYNSPYVDFTLNLTRGLMLFDDVIPEDKDIIYAPAGVNQIGAGTASAYNGACLECGSYNTSESGPIYNTGNTEWDELIGYKHVWDFSATRANGTIKSICLTTETGGYMTDGLCDNKTYSDFQSPAYNEIKNFKYLANPYYAIHSYGSKTSTSELISRINLTMIDSTNNQMVVWGDTDCNTYAHLYAQNKINAYYYDFPVNSCNLLTRINVSNSGSKPSGKNFSNNLIKKETFEMPNTLKEWMQGLAANAIYCQGNTCADKLFFIFHTSSSYAPGGIYQVWEINPWTKTNKHYQLTNTTQKTLFNPSVQLMNSTSSIIADHKSSVLGLDNGYFLMLIADTYRGYLVNAENTSDVTELGIYDYLNNEIVPITLGTSNGGFSGTDISKGETGRLYKLTQDKYVIGNPGIMSQYFLVIDCVNKNIKMKRGWIERLLNNGYIYRLKHLPDRYCTGMNWYIYNSELIEFYIDPSYLITVNNLSEPITKTNEYSMKITYVIKKA